MLPSTTDRVSANTTDSVNTRVRREMEERIAFLARNPSRIADRLGELDREWDVERVLEANAATLAFSGVALAAAHDRRWLALPALVTAFLFQHALQGWCPPLPVLRRLGFRTASEIAEERYALKALRGDFARVDGARGRASALLDAVRS